MESGPRLALGAPQCRARAKISGSRCSRKEVVLDCFVRGCLPRGASRLTAARLTELVMLFNFDLLA